MTLSPVTGRFAPSPTGRLHLGNLRTALVAWLSARSAGGQFLVRVEDLDRVTSSAQHEQEQLAHLEALGLDHDGEVVRQSDRFERYHDAIATLAAADLTYPCYCSRREIREAAEAPHGGVRRYPGTCRSLTAAQRSERERAGRPSALRLRADGRTVVAHDLLAGDVSDVVDDIVLRRNDGVPAYHVAVVVDDAAQGVTEVVRGDDLLGVTPSQVHLHELLDLPVPVYLHVPLVIGNDGERLAKRHGAITLPDLAEAGIDAHGVVALLAASLGLCGPTDRPAVADLVSEFHPARLTTTPWRFKLASWHPMRESST